jgi:hypothetical protein
MGKLIGYNATAARTRAYTKLRNEVRDEYAAGKPQSNPLVVMGLLIAVALTAGYFFG